MRKTSGVDDDGLRLLGSRRMYLFNKLSFRIALKAVERSTEAAAASTRRALIEAKSSVP